MNAFWKFLKEQVLDIIKGAIIDILVKIFFIVAIIWGSLWAYERYVVHKVTSAVTEKVDTAKQFATDAKAKALGFYRSAELNTTKEDVKETASRAWSRFKPLIEKDD